MHATTVAVDIAKEVFELAFADSRGHIIERKRLTRRMFARAFEQRPPLRIVMENILLMAKGSVPKRNTPITIPAFEAAWRL
jgi:hypothetical protein